MSQLPSFITDAVITVISAWKSILVAIVLVFVGTANGRKLVTQNTVARLKPMMYGVPLDVRRKSLLFVNAMPLKVARFLLNHVTQVTPDQLDWVLPVEKETWKGNWISPDARKGPRGKEWENYVADQSDLIILYYHGGGFRLGCSTMYMDFFIQLIESLAARGNLQARILSVEYTLSPEAAWPKAQEQCIDAYRYLVHDLSISPSRIIIAGESAGGNLVATCTLAIRDQRQHPKLVELPPLPMPLGCIMLSPWTSLEMDADRYVHTTGTDYVEYSQLERHVKDYLPQVRTMDSEAVKALLQQPGISPRYGNYEGFCPTLVTVGGAEMLREEIRIMIDVLRRDKVNVAVMDRAGAMHNWIGDPALNVSHDLWLQDVEKLVDWCVETKNAHR